MCSKDIDGKNGEGRKQKMQCKNKKSNVNEKQFERADVKVGSKSLATFQQNAKRPKLRHVACCMQRWQQRRKEWQVARQFIEGKIELRQQTIKREKNASKGRRRNNAIKIKEKKC